jgi:hypothetical protein
MNRALRLPESEVEYAHALVDAAQVATVQALVSAGVLSPYMSLRECQDMHGVGTVNNWLRQGIIHRIKDGEGNTKVRISRVEVETAVCTNNRAVWYIDQYVKENKRLHYRRLKSSLEKEI